MIRSAVISACGNYRYRLARIWGAANEPTVLWVMLNPSTADASIDDPTIKRCIAFSQREGFGSMLVENLYAYRSTDPAKMLRLAATEATGPENYLRMVEARNCASKIICAWGNPGGTYAPNALRGAELWCLGKTGSGAPRHPLYLHSATPLVRFN